MPLRLSALSAKRCGLSAYAPPRRPSRKIVVLLSQFRYTFLCLWHWRLTKLDTSLPHSPSAQLAEAQAEQIVQVLQKRWNGEEPPSEFPPIKLKGILGSLGKKHGFGLVADRPLTGRVPRLLKSGILWMYKYHHGY